MPGVRGKFTKERLSIPRINSQLRGAHQKDYKVQSGNWNLPGWGEKGKNRSWFIGGTSLHDGGNGGGYTTKSDRNFKRVSRGEVARSIMGERKLRAKRRKLKT